MHQNCMFFICALKLSKKLLINITSFKLIYDGMLRSTTIPSRFKLINNIQPQKVYWPYQLIAVYLFIWSMEVLPTKFVYWSIHSFSVMEIKFFHIKFWMPEDTITVECNDVSSLSKKVETIRFLCISINICLTNSVQERSEGGNPFHN